MPDAEKVRKHSSRMKGNFHVRFLGEGKQVTAFSYPTYNSMKNCKLPSVCRIDVLILKFVAIEVYFFVLSFDFYKENCSFRVEFSTNAYVFVFSCDKKLCQKIADQSDPYPLKVSLPWHAFPVTGRCEAHGTT